MSAEGAAASAVVTQLALSHPDVSFKLLRDGAEVLHTPGNGALLPGRTRSSFVSLPFTASEASSNATYSDTAGQSRPSMSV